MAKPAATSAPTLIERAPVSRSRRAEAILGRDWKVALPFVLPMVVIMAGLIFWPFVNAIWLSLTTRSLVTRTDQYVGFAIYVRLCKDADFRVAVNIAIVFTVASM